jgi:hypothetical protein
MLSERELRFLIKKKLMIKEGLLPNSSAGKNAGVPSKPGLPPTKKVTTTGGLKSSSAGATSSFLSSSGTPNDEDDLKKLAKTLGPELARPKKYMSYTDQENKDYQVAIVAAIMKKVSENNDDAKLIFGTNPEEKINNFYTKKLTTKDLFADADSTVQTALADMATKGEIRYDPATNSQTTWSSGAAKSTDNFPFYWLKLMIDKKFNLTQVSGIKYVNGMPQFSTTSKNDLNDQTLSLYGETHNRFKSSYREYVDSYYDLRSGGILGGGGINDYFDNNEGLAYLRLLENLIDNDYDQENLPMVRMFFATIAAEAYTGYRGGGPEEEAMAVFAVGEDQRVRDFFDGGGTLQALVDDPAAEIGASGGVALPAEYYNYAYLHVSEGGFGSRLDRFNPLGTGLTSKVDKTKKKLLKTIAGILKRKLDGSSAKTMLNVQQYNIDAYDEEIGTELYSPPDDEKAAVNEQTIRDLIREKLLENKKAKKNVALDAEFDNLLDPKGYVFVHFGSSNATISPQVFEKPKNASKANVKRATTLYELCYYSPHWLTVGSSDNPLEALTPFDMLYALYEVVELNEVFDLNNVAVFPASKLINIGKKLQAGTDPTGSKTAGPFDPAGSPPPNSAELTAFQNALVTGPHAMEAMRVKEVVNGIFSGIREDDKGKGTKFLKYMESQKESIMIGKGLTKTYAQALEKGLKDPAEAAQQDKDKDSINKMYEFIATMKEFTSSEKSDILAEGDKALAANKMELDKIKTKHPMFHKGFLILMQKKIPKGGNLSFDDMQRIADNFKRTASAFNLMPNISGLFSFFNNLRTAQEVSSKQRIKLSAAGSNEISFNQAFGAAPNDKVIVASGTGIPTGTSFDPSKSESAMSEFSKLLKDSDNTLNQEVTITLGCRAGKVKRIKKIEDRLGGNIKIGLRRWVNKNLIPSITPPAAYSGDLTIKFPPARYVGKALMEEDVTKKLIKLIREYSS